jgi:hypothetical protein
LHIAANHSYLWNNAASEVSMSAANRAIVDIELDLGRYELRRMDAV